MKKKKNNISSIKIYQEERNMFIKPIHNGYYLLGYYLEDIHHTKCKIIDYPTQVIIKKDNKKKTRFYDYSHISFDDLQKINSLTFSEIESVLKLTIRPVHQEKFQFHSIKQEEDKIEFLLNGRRHAHIRKEKNRFHIQVKGKYCMIRLDNMIQGKKTYVVLEHIKHDTIILNKKRFFHYPELNINILKDFLINNPDFRMRDIRSLIYQK